METQIKMLEDRFGRTHDYLRISLTERCNLRCFYCMPEEGIPLRDKAEFMSTEELLTITQTFVDLGVKKIRLTGGEPTIRKDFGNILLELGKLPIELAVTTNAVIIDKFIPELKQAGVKSINVSLDSLKEERFNKISRRNYFQQIKQNILLLIDEGFKVKINVVVIKGVNDDELIDFVKSTQTLSVQVRFIEFMPFDGNNWDWSKKVSQQEILSQIRLFFGENEIERRIDAKNDTTRNYQLRDAIGSFGIISSVTNPFCDTCNRLRLTADGKMKNCLFSSSETDLLAALRNEESIQELIRVNVLEKEKMRGGITDFEAAEQRKNRSMVSIGG